MNFISHLLYLAFESKPARILRHLSFFVLRVGIGASMLTHGIPKLIYFGDRVANFPDPLNIGSEWSLGLAIFAEVFGTGALMLGFLSRLAALNLLATMVVAARLGFEAQGFVGAELATVYGVIYLIIVFFGPGNISVDYLLCKKTEKISQKKKQSEKDISALESEKNKIAEEALTE